MECDVLLYIYDLSAELAKAFSKILKGKSLPGIWHTGLVAYGREYYFGASGIESCRPGETILGEPDQILRLGRTELPYSLFLEYIFGLGETTFKPGSYHLFGHNGNSFSQEVSQFLTGTPIPPEIADIPKEITSNKTVSGALTEYFDKLSLKAEGNKGISFVAREQRNGQSNFGVQEQSNGQSSLVAQERNNGQPTFEAQERNNWQSTSEAQEPSNGQPTFEAQEPINGQSTSEAQEPSIGQSSSVAEEQTIAMDPVPNGAAQQPQVDCEAETAGQREEPTVRRSRRYDDPPIIFPTNEGPSSLRRLLESRIGAGDARDLEELLEYLETDGGAWALGASHLDTLGRLLAERGGAAGLALRALQAAALKEDAILLLHQDREKHTLMSFFYHLDALPEQEQVEAATLLCNLCSQASSFDWLTYISEWEEEGRPCSNARATVRAAVHALLAPHTRPQGAALVYNLALKKELFDDIATELAMAVMQALQEQLPEDLLFQCLTALYRFMCISYNEVPALLKMMGPDVGAFQGTSPRVDSLLKEIEAKMRASRPI